MTVAKDNLLSAVLKVQSEAPTLPKDKTNPHFRSKFTGLDTIVEKIGPILNKHGLVWMAKPGISETGHPTLDYTLAHVASGEREEGSMPLLLSKQDAQSMGSAITYARRYSLCAVLNLVADDDDDGNGAGQGNGRAQTPAPPPSLPDDLVNEVASMYASLVKAGTWSKETAQMHLTASEATFSGPLDTQGKVKAAVRTLSPEKAQELRNEMADLMVAAGNGGES